MVILTERHNPDTINIDLMDSSQIAKAINQEDQKVALAVEKEVDHIGKAIDFIADSFLKGGRLAYFGAGTSGRLGVLDASECVPTFGVEEGLVRGYIAGGDQALRHSIENAEDNTDLALKDLEDFVPTKKDVVVGISASGNPKYVLTVLEKAREAGAKTVGITSNPEAKLNAFSDVVICPVVGPEAITGSSRMKAGTAQKMVLNMLTTGAMIKIGKTYHNYMIDVRVVNEKLYDRACRFISEICGVDMKEAALVLEESERKVKTACVMKIKNCSRQEAEKMLTSVNGVLRKVIG